MKKKKIAFLVNSLGTGGAERVASVLLNHLAKQQEYTFELILLEDEHFYTIPDSIKITTLSKLTWSDSPLKRTAYIPIYAYRLSRYIKQNDISFVLSFIYRSDFVNVLASMFSKHTFSLSNHVNASTTYGDNSIASKINNFLIKKLYPKAPLVINVSNGVQDDLYKNYNIPLEKQTVIYNPYNIKDIKEKSLEEIDFDTDRTKTIVVASRLDSVKNVNQILDALSTLNRDFKLIILGKGSQSQALKDQAKKLGISQNVIFTGRQNNPYKYFKNAAIYISASSSEGFPMALVEAMICQCAVISSDCKSGPREILSPETKFSDILKEGIEYAPYGLLFAVDDTKSLAEAINFYLDNPKECQYYSKQGHKRALEFDISIIANKYIKTIKEQLAKSEL